MFSVGFVLNKMQPDINRASAGLFFCLPCWTGTCGRGQEQTPAGIMQWNGRLNWLYLKWLGILAVHLAIKIITLKSIDKRIQFENTCFFIFWDIFM